MRNVGIAFDNFSGNTGDEAIGISVKKILNSFDISFVELYSCSETQKFGPIIIGGGHLLREISAEPVYNQFRIRGNHILNAMGIHGTPNDLDYLEEYAYVSVRSQGDRNKIEYVDKVNTVPCTTMLLEDLVPFKYKLKPHSIGIHIYPEMFSSEDMIFFIAWSKFQIKQGHTLYFLPITHYRNDYTLFEPIVNQIGDGCFLLSNLGALEVFTLIGKLTYMISYSLHGAIFAYIHNITFLLATIYEKNKFFMEDRGLMSYTFKTIPDLVLLFDADKKPDYSTLIINDIRILREHVYTINTII